MFKSNFVAAMRCFFRDKWYSLLGVLGLSVGIASCLLAWMHITYEWSYDQHLPGKDRLVRMVLDNPQEGEYFAGMSAPVPVLMKEQFPEIQAYARLGRYSWDEKNLVQYQHNTFYEDYVLLADPAIFQLLGCRFLRGDASTALASDDEMVITERVATKYFGKEDPIGRMLTVDGKHAYRVTGVVENPSVTSHLQYDFLVSFNNLDALYHQGASRNWGAFNYQVYAKLAPNTSRSVLEQKIQTYKHVLNKEKEITFEEVFLQPVTDIHFQPGRGNQQDGYDRSFLWVFFAAAATVLIIALINYINLATARAQRRLKETGVRKALGASRKHLFIQHFTESLVFTLLAVVVAILLVELALPFFRNLLDNPLRMPYGNYYMYLLLVVLVLGVSFLSGGYLVFYVVSLPTLTALKSKAMVRKMPLQKLLVASQFAMSALLIICAWVMIGQLRMMSNKPLGIEKDQALMLSLYGNEAQKAIPRLKQELLKVPGVTHTGATSFVPGDPNYNQTVWWEGQEESTSFYLIPCDKDFIEASGLKLVEGSMSTVHEPKERVTYILNEQARKYMGWTQALGKQFSAYGSENASQVTAVVADFHYQTLHHGIKPMAFVIRPSVSQDKVLLRTSHSNMEHLLPEIKEAFVSVLPDTPFEYVFMEDDFAALYTAEKRAEKMVTFLGALSIAIALLGILALTTFALRQRTKEIAIRKVLGSNRKQLVRLFSREFLWLVVPGILIAWPLAWYFMRDWLNHFSYRINLGVTAFAFTTLLLGALVFLLVAVKVILAARANPVDALRYE
ncbi:MAG: FtsX-like permease family protein [Bacteroidota bacterium]